MTISLPSHIAPSPNVLFQELAGESILLNLASERYYSFDDIGTRMWQLLSQHGDTHAVVTQMLAEYDVDEASLRHDLGDLITKLTEAGLVIVTG